MEENKKSNGLVILTVALAILLILVSGYIVYDKLYLSKNNNGKVGNDKPETVEIKEQDLDVKSDLVKKLFEKTYFGTISCAQRASEIEKDFMKVTDFTNSQRLGIAILSVKGTGSITEEKVKEAYKEIFGNNVAYQASAVEACPYYIYDAKQKLYYVDSVNHACGEVCFDEEKEEIISAKKYSDKIEITSAVAYCMISEEDGKVGCYSDPQETNNISKDSKINIVDYKDKLTKYKYTFTYDKESNNYYYYSVERIK